MNITVRLALAFSTISAYGQHTVRSDSICPERVGVFPAYGEASREAFGKRARFELHRCGLGRIQVLLYEENTSQPAISFDTGDGWPRQLVNIGNVLALQTVGGSGSAVYVFHFVHGKATKATTFSASDNMRVSMSEAGDEVVIEVPPNPRIMEDAKRVTFRLE